MDTRYRRYMEDETLDLLQAASVPVPLDQFRLLPDCLDCQVLQAFPATDSDNARIRDHVLSDHADLVCASSV